MAQILVVGNEKGGAGKSTLAMHIATGLLQSNKKLAIIDLDLRQLSLKRFFENRDAYCKSNRIKLPTPMIAQIDQTADAEGWEKKALHSAINMLGRVTDYVLVDCPGALTPFSEAAHTAADILITPMNDSFIDFDLLARIDPETGAVKGPSIYSEMVWNARKARASTGKNPVDWIVARNRLPSQDMHNKRKIGQALENLSKRIGFRLAPGLSDRVVFKELFTKGLTIADPKEITQLQSSMSNIAARQELRDLLIELNLPDFKVGF